MPEPVAVTVSAYPTSSDVGTYDADVAPEIAVSPRYHWYVAVAPLGETAAVISWPTLGASVERVTPERGDTLGLLLTVALYSESA